MYKVKVNRATLKNHLHYDWWKYLVGIFVTIFLWNLIYTTTRPQTPADKKVDIFLVGEFIIDQEAEKVSQTILKDFPELQEINFISIIYDAESEIDYGGITKLAVMFASKTGDIFVMQEQEFEKYASMGAFMPLDPYLDESVLKYISMEELNHYRYKLQDPEAEYQEDESTGSGEQEETDEEPYVYGIPLKGINLFDSTGYYSENKVMGVAHYSKNHKKAIEVMKWIIANGKQ